MKREWVGGRYTLPHQVRDGDATFQPDVIFWLELPRGVLVGSTLVDPRKPVSFAQSLEDAMQRPDEGSPRRPSRIRVADDRLAVELRKAAAGIPIVVAPVPELDETFDDLAETLAGNEAQPSYLGDGEISPEIVGELFEAAGLLFRTAPWRHVLDQQAVRVDIPHFGIDGAALSVIGNAGESFGLILFSSIDDYLSFGNADAPRAARSDGGLSLRSLSFDRKKEVPPSMLHEIEQHRWPVAGAKAYPVLLCVGREMDPRPLLEKDVRIMTAVTRAFLAYYARNRELFDAEDPEPVRESSEGDDGVTVTVTAPYTVFDDDSFKPPTPSMPAVGRNEPCPCGSGKKYKKCHLEADQAPSRALSEIESVHEMDFRLVKAMAKFASNRFGSDWLDVDFDDVDDALLELTLPWITWTVAVDGHRVADAYLEQHGPRLSAEEREWVAAQRGARLSVWEVTANERGRVEVRDLLTGETRSVREELTVESVGAHDTLLARVIDFRGASYFGGIHGYPLPPGAADRLAEEVRTSVPVEHLQDPKTGWLLIERWEDVLAEEEDDDFDPPALHNTDGDPLLFFTDSFRFAAKKRTEVEKRIEAMDDFESARTAGEEREHVFVRSSDDTVIGRVIVGRDALRIETNSENRADALGRRVEEACTGLLRNRKRDIQQPPTLEGAAASDAAPVERSTEEQSVLSEFKNDYYRRWLDTPIPALGGKTPRAATRSAKSRRELDVLLLQIENGESLLPEAERFDVGRLRRELGLES